MRHSRPLLGAARMMSLDQAIRRASRRKAWSHGCGCGLLVGIAAVSWVLAFVAILSPFVPLFFSAAGAWCIWRTKP